jgi:hypothetical protein
VTTLNLESARAAADSYLPHEVACKLSLAVVRAERRLRLMQQLDEWLQLPGNEALIRRSGGRHVVELRWTAAGTMTVTGASLEDALAQALQVIEMELVG